MNGPTLQEPIVLVHGILGFDRVGLGRASLEYFRGIPEALRGAGNTVPEPPALDPAGSVQERARNLKLYLETDADVVGRQVHLIAAHSMGGLDSRYMISILGMADRVLSLTTLGTPHQGTPAADLNASVFGPLLNLLSLAGLDLQGFFDLTVRNSREFSLAAVADVKGINYYSVAGLYEPGLFTVGLLRPTHDFILAKAGPNDGLVPVTSATFGTFLDTWQANHFRLINWPTNLVGPEDEKNDTSIIDNYLGLVRRLAQDMP